VVAEAGGKLIGGGVDEGRVQAATDELGARSVAPDAIFGVRCDVFAPCAVGGILNDRSIPELRASTVVGSANNQLEAPRHAAALAERGILYAPDFIVNAGGALAFSLLDRGMTDHEEIRSRVRGIGDALGRVLRAASERDQDTLTAAHRLVASRLAARPALDDAGRDPEPAGVGGV
jgi:leucine dehydrogenase